MMGKMSYGEKPLGCALVLRGHRGTEQEGQGRRLLFGVCTLGGQGCKKRP